MDVNIQPEHLSNLNVSDLSSNSDSESAPTNTTKPSKVMSFGARKVATPGAVKKAKATTVKPDSSDENETKPVDRSKEGSDSQKISKNENGSTKRSNKPSVVASKVKKAQSAKKGVQKDADKKKVVKMAPANIEHDSDIVMFDAKINDKPKMSPISNMKLENPALLESLREEIVTSLSATSNLPTDKHPLKECPFCSTFATRDLLNEHKQSNHTEKNGRKQTTESAPTTKVEMSSTQTNPSQTSASGGAANARYFPELQGQDKTFGSETAVVGFNNLIPYPIEPISFESFFQNDSIDSGFSSMFDTKSPQKKFGFGLSIRAPQGEGGRYMQHPTILEHFSEQVFRNLIIGRIVLISNYLEKIGVSSRKK